MNKKVKILLSAIAFIGVISFATIGYNYLSKNYELSDRQKESKDNQKDSTKEIITATDFNVLNQNGERISLKDNFGKPIVVNFWATWCGPCKSEMPAFNSLYKEYKDDVTFMMVNLTDGRRDTIEKVDEFIRTNGYDFPVYYDTEYNASYAYGVSGIPMSIFINEKGEISDYHVGAMTEEILKNYIKEIS